MAMIWSDDPSKEDNTSSLVAATPNTTPTDNSITISPSEQKPVEEAKSVIPKDTMEWMNDADMPKLDKTVINEPKNDSEMARDVRFSATKINQDGSKTMDFGQLSNWSPTAAEAGTEAYSQSDFKATLDDFLNSQAKTDSTGKVVRITSTEYLNNIGTQKYNEIMAKAPVPKAMTTFTSDDKARFDKEQAEYNLYQQGAHAQAEQAIQAEKGTLWTKVKDYSERRQAEQIKKLNENGDYIKNPANDKIVYTIMGNMEAIDTLEKDLANTNGSPSAILSLIPTYAKVGSIAANPTVQPSEFSIEEAKAFVGQVAPWAAEGPVWENALKAGLAWIAANELNPGGAGPNPLTVFLDQVVHNNPIEVAKRMQHGLKGIKKIAVTVKSGYVGHNEPIKPDTHAPSNEPPEPTNVTADDFTNPNSPKKADAIYGSLMRWNKMTSLTTEEKSLGITDPNKSATGENEGVVAFQSYLKNKLGATNYKVTGIPSADDQAALQILMKREPSKSAKDIMTEALAHKGQMDGSLGGETSGKSAGKAKPAKPAKPARRMATAKDF